MRKLVLTLMVVPYLWGQPLVTGPRVDLSHAMATKPFKIVDTLPTGLSPQVPCMYGDMVLLTTAPRGQQLYQNMGTGACDWVQSSGGGGGLQDPGANGIVKRISLNTTAIAGSSDITSLFTGCSGGTPILSYTGACVAGGGGGSGSSYITNATSSPQSIPASTHNQGVNADTFCFSGPVSAGTTTGLQVTCQAAKLNNGDITVTWTGTAVQSIQVFSSGPGPAGPPGPPGSVTSVGFTAPAIFNVSGSPITTSGTIAMSLATQIAHSFLTGPTSGSPAAPTFRLIVASDLPSTITSNTTGTAAALTATPTLCSTGFSPTGILPNGNATGCQAVGGGGSATPYVVNSSSSPQTILAATHNQGINPYVFCWDGALSSGATSGNIVGCAVQKLNSAGDIRVFWAGSTVGSIEIMAAGGGGGGGGSGTVTSVSLNLPGSLFSISGSPVTTSGTLAGSLVTQLANTGFFGPTIGSPAAPTFRAMVAADLPSVINSNTTGTAASATTATQLAGTPTLCATGNAPTGILPNGNATGCAIIGGGSGTVTNVAMSVPGIMIVAGSPVTTAGTLAVSLATQAANMVFAGPTSGGATMPTFRALVASDIPNPITSNTSGNAATASAFAGIPSQCSTGFAPTGISANGNATGCAAISSGSTNPLTPATLGAGTVTVVGGTVVSGFGTNFNTLFPLCAPTCTHGEAIAIYPPTANQAGHFTATPLPGQNLNNNGETGSLVWGVDGTTFGLIPGDMLTPIRNYSAHSGINFSSYTPVYPGAAYGQSEFWSMTTTLQSNLVETALPIYPSVGSRYPYPYIMVPFGAGSAYLISNTPHGLSNGVNVTVSGSPGGAWDGTYNVINNSFNSSLPAASCVLVTNNPRGLPSGVYAVDGLSMNSGGPIGIIPTVSITVSGGTATATFLYPHGFSVNDAIHISGFTGWTGGTSATVATVGNNDWPTTLTFATSASNGTYSNQAGAISIGYKLSPRPSWVKVASVSSNTGLSLSSSVANTGGAVYYAAPDNYSAFQTMITANKDVIITQGDYYFNNSVANTGQSDGRILANNWSAYMGGRTTRFILTQPDKNGFNFVGGSNATFDNLTVETLYQVPNTICTYPASCFPASFGIYNADRPRVLNIASNISTSNFLDIENSTNPITVGFRIRNVGLGGCYVMAADTHPVLSNGICENDNDGQSIFMQNNYIDQNMRGAVLSNITSINTGPALWFGVPDIEATNLYMEGAQTSAIMTEPTSGTTGNIKLNNIQINNNASLGPADQIYGTYALNVQGALSGITINGLSIRTSFGDGINVGGTTDVSISNSLVDSVTWDCLQMASGTTVRLSNVTLSSCGGLALLNLSGTLFANNLNIKNSSTVNNPGYPGALPGTSIISSSGFGDFKGLRIIDTNLTARSNVVQCSPCRVTDVTAQITDSGHPLTYTYTPGQSFFTNGSGAISNLSTIGFSANLQPATDTFVLSGSGTIQSITFAPNGAMQEGDQVCAIPAGGSSWVTVTGGNIALGTSPVATRMLCWRYVGSLWYPSY